MYVQARSMPCTVPSAASMTSFTRRVESCAPSMMRHLPPPQAGSPQRCNLRSRHASNAMLLQRNARRLSDCGVAVDAQSHSRLPDPASTHSPSLSPNTQILGLVTVLTIGGRGTRLLVSSWVGQPGRALSDMADRISIGAIDDIDGCQIACL